MWIIATLAGPLWAAEGKIDPATCDQTAKNQGDINDCALAQYEVADEKLNTTYQKLVHMTRDDIAKKLLVKAQRAWIAFRDAECDWDRDIYRGGSMAPAEYWACLAHLSDDRTKQLQQAMCDLRN